MLTHGNFTAEVAMLGRVFALDGNDVVLSLLPLHHTFEFTCGMLLPLASGARIVYPLGVDAASLSRTLADVRPTALVGVPALWEAVHRRIMDEVDARGPFFQAAFGQLRDLESPTRQRLSRQSRQYHLSPGPHRARWQAQACGERGCGIAATRRTILQRYRPQIARGLRSYRIGAGPLRLASGRPDDAGLGRQAARRRRDQARRTRRWRRRRDRRARLQRDGRLLP